MTDVSEHPLTALRRQRGWTLVDVANLVQRRTGLNMACRREKVWRWEHGVTPEVVAQHALAAELGLPQQIIGRHPWPRWLELADPAEPVDVPWTAVGASRTLDRVVESAGVDRRHFLILSGTGLATAWLAAEPEHFAPLAAGRVTDDTVTRLQARVEQLWHLDDELGGGACLDTGTADLRLVATLIRHGSYTPAVAIRLYSLAAALARFCGFAAFDAGHDAAGQRFWHAALRCAAACGDTDQGVYVLSNLALQAIYSQDGATALALLDVARRRVDPAARTVLAMLDCWAARAHSVLGEPGIAARLLNHADDLWLHRQPGDDPGWVYWMPQPSLTAEAGTTLLDIGDLSAAQRCLTAGVATLDPGAVRDRNLYHVRIGQAHLRAGNLDAAASSTEQVIDMAATVESARVHARVDQLLGEFPDGEPVTTELRQRWTGDH